MQERIRPGTKVLCDCRVQEQDKAALPSQVLQDPATPQGPNGTKPQSIFKALRGPARALRMDGGGKAGPGFESDENTP